MKTFVRNPLVEDVLDYLWEWGDWLATGETIISKEVTVPAGLTELSSSIVGGDSVVVWISGGVIGQNYVVAVKVTTDFGRTKTRRARFEIKEH